LAIVKGTGSNEIGDLLIEDWEIEEEISRQDVRICVTADRGKEKHSMDEDD